MRIGESFVHRRKDMDMHVLSWYMGITSFMRWAVNTHPSRWTRLGWSQSQMDVETCWKWKVLAIAHGCYCRSSRSFHAAKRNTKDLLLQINFCVMCSMCSNAIHGSFNFHCSIFRKNYWSELAVVRYLPVLKCKKMISTVRRPESVAYGSWELQFAVPCSTRGEAQIPLNSNRTIAMKICRYSPLSTRNSAEICSLPWRLKASCPSQNCNFDSRVHSNWGISFNHVPYWPGLLCRYSENNQ